MFNLFSSKVTAAAFSALILVGCSSGLKKPEPKPAKLVGVQTNQPGVNLVLQTSLGSGFEEDPLRLEPAVVGSTVYAVSRTGTLKAVSLSGDTLWSKSVGSEVTSGVAANEQLVVVGESNGVLSGFNPAGELLWSASTESAVLSAALITDSKVIVQATDGVVSAFDASSGELLWKHGINIPAVSLRGSSKPVELTPKIVVIGGADGKLHAIRSDVGVPLWSERVSAPLSQGAFAKINDLDSDPLVAGANLFTASFGSYVQNTNLIGRTRVFKSDVSSNKPMSLSADALVVADSKGVVWALDPTTGETLWSTDSLAYRGLSGTAVLGGNAYVGDSKGVIHAFELATGTYLGRVQTKGAVISLSTQGDLLVAQTSTGVVSVWSSQGS